MNKSEFSLRFGSFLKKKRKKNNWSQAELASRMGNNYQNISSIERGEVTPTLFWVYNLSIAFNENYSDLMSEFTKEIIKEESGVAENN